MTESESNLLSELDFLQIDSKAYYDIGDDDLESTLKLVGSKRLICARFRIKDGKPKFRWFRFTPGGFVFIPFEQVLELVPDELIDKLLFHIDLFR